MKKIGIEYLYCGMRVSKKEITNFSDEELIVFYCQKKDKRFLGEIYQRYGHLVYGTCLNYMKNKEDAEDIVMDIFVSLGQKLEKYEVKYFKSWLYMLTKNECLNRLKKKKQHLSFEDNSVYTEEDEIPLKVEKELKLSTLETTIEELGSPQAEVIRLFYIKQLSYKEISEQLNLSINKVKSAVQNGKRNLKIKLMKHDFFKSA